MSETSTDDFRVVAWAVLEADAVEKGCAIYESAVTPFRKHFYSDGIASRNKEFWPPYNDLVQANFTTPIPETSAYLNAWDYVWEKWYDNTGHKKLSYKGE